MKTNADVKNLSEVLGFIDNFLESVNCPPKAQMQIDTSVEEIFVNIAGYAYQDNKGTADIEIYLTDNNTVCIELTDSGKPFNPLAKADPDTSLSASERKIGGLGIFMVKKIGENFILQMKSISQLQQIDNSLLINNH